MANGFDLSEYVIAEQAYVHPMANVDATASLGPRTKVWQFASVVRGAKVGSDCSIASCAIVDGALVGNGTIISHGAFIDPGIRISDGVFIGPNVSLCNDNWPRVDKAGWFDVRDLVSGEIVVTHICNGASLGAGVVVLPGVIIGAGAMIAAGAVVGDDVPDLMLFRRDGTMQPIDPARNPKRKRSVA